MLNSHVVYTRKLGTIMTEEKPVQRYWKNHLPSVGKCSGRFWVPTGNDANLIPEVHFTKLYKNY